MKELKFLQLSRSFVTSRHMSLHHSPLTKMYLKMKVNIIKISMTLSKIKFTI